MGAAAGRNLDYRVRSSIEATVVNGFDLGNVHGLTALPTFTQRKNYDITEPFVFFESEGSLEIDKTKNVATREYSTIVEVITSYDSELGGPHITDLIADEVIRIVTTTDPTVSNADVYVQTVDSVFSSSYEIENRVFFQKDITILTRVAQHTENTPGNQPGNLPVQAPIFTPANFVFTPTLNRIELYDAGTITPATTYSSDNNGFDFTSATYALTPTSDGTLANGVVTVDADDEVSITSTLVYTSETNTGSGTMNDTSMALTLGDAEFVNSGNTYKAVLFDTSGVDSINFARPPVLRGGETVSISIGTTNFLNLTVSNNVTNTLAALPGGQAASIVITQDMHNAMAALGTQIGDDTYILESDFRVYLGATIPQIPSTTETLRATTAFPRIRSLRYGVLSGTTIDITDFAFARDDRNTIRYGTIAPSGQVINLAVRATETPYIAYDESQPDLTGIAPVAFPINEINSWTLTRSNGFKIWIQNNPFAFDNNLHVTLT